MTTRWLGIATAVMLGLTHPAGAADENVSSDGWIPLFDGKSLAGWRTYGGKAAIGPGWKVEDGILKKLDGVKGGDIVSTNTFTDFELYWEWRVAPGANNGVKYLVTESRPAAPGHEYQMIDDLSPKYAGLAEKQSTAAYYDVFAPAADKPVKPGGEWNTSRVIVRGMHVEHWLNGRKVVEYELESPAQQEGIAHSKFAKYPDFGKKIAGHIMLTDHHDEAWYRVIRIRPLAP